jgi:hypothetical protein
MTRFLAVLGALVLLAGCAKLEQPTRAAVVDGHIRVLDRIPGQHPNAAPDQWWSSRTAGQGQLAVVDLQGTLAVRADMPGGSLMGRRVDAALTATPYLRWSWYLEPLAFGGGPGTGQERGLRVVVFYRSTERPAIEDWRSWLRVSPAEWDRSVQISFGGHGAARAEQAMQRKAVGDDAGRTIPLREPRTEQAGAWHVEAIDLAELHRRFWPNENPANVRVAMIAFGGYAGEVPPGLPGWVGYVADVVLSR